jgi:hypothetical protein
MLDATDVGYAGPHFSYAAIPDQYTLAHFARTELRPDHGPVMAEIDLVSSHTPWTPLPHLVDPAALGDGSIYDPMPAEGVPPRIAWQNPKAVQALYAQSVQYSIDALTGFIAASSDKNLVVLMLGDHQPAEIVSGPHAGHDVPVSLISADPAVLQAVEGWHWTAGLRPGTSGPTWRMDRFRDRFLDAFTGMRQEAARTGRPGVEPSESLRAVPQPDAAARGIRSELGPARVVAGPLQDALQQRVVERADRRRMRLRQPVEGAVRQSLPRAVLDRLVPAVLQGGVEGIR